MEDVVVKARFVMFKVFGHQSNQGYNPYMGPFFADRTGENDGTVGHVPGESEINVDYAYATVNNVFDMPIWFSIGRRPSTGGIPGNLRMNQEKQGTAGIPSILVDYAFDGVTLGWAPDIAALPGMYAKLCAGRGYDSGYRFSNGFGGTGGSRKDTGFLGLNLGPYDAEKLHQCYCRVSNLKVQRDYFKAINVVLQRTQPIRNDHLEWDQKEAMECRG